MVVLDGEELPISICLIQHRLAHKRLAWELITTPRRSCARPSNATSHSCYSAMFPTQGIQYSQVCGRVIGYQFGQPTAFFDSESYVIDKRYVDGVSLTYGSPHQHIWTFANALQEGQGFSQYACPCTNSNEQQSINITLVLQCLLLHVDCTHYSSLIFIVMRVEILLTLKFYYGTYTIILYFVIITQISPSLVCCFQHYHSNYYMIHDMSSNMYLLNTCM